MKKITMKTLDRISFYMCIVLIIYIFFSEIQSIKTEIKSIKIEKQFVPLTDFELIELAIIWQETKFKSKSEALRRTKRRYPTNNADLRGRG